MNSNIASMVEAIGRQIGDLKIARYHLMLAGGFDLPPTEILHPGADPISPPAEIVNRKSKIGNRQRRGKGGKRPTGPEHLKLETEHSPSVNVSAEYRKLMHPELAAVEPEKPARGGSRMSALGDLVTEAMRAAEEPFTAATLAAANPALDVDFANYLFRTLKRGWITKHSRGQYVRSGAFPKSSVENRQS